MAPVVARPLAPECTHKEQGALTLRACYWAPLSVEGWSRRSGVHYEPQARLAAPYGKS